MAQYIYAVAIRPAAGHNFIALFVRHFLCAHVKAQVSVRYTKSVYLRGINLGWSSANIYYYNFACSDPSWPSCGWLTSSFW